MGTIENRCVNGQCSCCGECCTAFLPMTEKEIKTLREYVKAHNIQQNKWLIGNDQHVLCPFLTTDRKCSIYPRPGEKDVRPFVCRNFKCSKSDKTIKRERIMYAVRADINKSNEDETWFGNYCSTHSAIFDDYDWDLDFIAGQARIAADGDEAKFELAVKAVSALFVRLTFN